MYKQYLNELLIKYEFPTESVKSLLVDYDKISKNTAVYARFLGFIKDYADGKIKELENTTNKIKEISGHAGVHEYSGCLLFYLLITKPLKEKYQQQNYPKDMFDGLIIDIKEKMLESFNRFDIWGTYVSFWFNWFFEYKLFSMGRLQFIKTDFNATYSKNGITVTEKDKVISVHIPSTGKLDKAEILKSYKRAYEFFPECRKNGLGVFICCSWIFCPLNKKILAPTSNLLAFINDYQVYSIEDDEEFPLWRMFYKEVNNPVETWSEDTSLKRGYKKAVMDGETLEGRNAIMFFDGQNVVS